MQPQAPGPNLPSMQPPPANYDFIVNPGSAPKKPLFKFGGGSMLGRVVIVGIILLALMLFFIVIKAVTTKPTPTAYYVAVAQDQSLLTHIASSTVKQDGIKTATLNSAVTVDATITSAQANLLAYAGSVHAKISTKQLDLKIKPTIDTALTDAATAGTYDAVYKTTMGDALSVYLQDLKSAYNHTTGPRGRAELANEYAGAQLLVKQLK